MSIIVSQTQNFEKNQRHLQNDFETLYTDWQSLKADGYETKTNLKFDQGRVPIRGERPSAAYVERKIYTRSQWRETRQQHERRLEDLNENPTRLEYFVRQIGRINVTPLPNGKIEVISKLIPVYHISQTRPANFRARTKAIIKYGNVFWRPSQSSNYIKKNLDPNKYDAKWFTKDFDQRDFDFEPFEFFSERQLLEHINQRNIYGVKPDARKLQWWCGVDLDLHVEKGGRQDIFLKQANAVLKYLQGKKWIVCLGKDNVDGIHLIKLFDAPKPLQQIRQELQSILNEISSRHPGLEREALDAGMNPISMAEIFPDTGRGFRLPLGIGYTALTNKPLALVKYHTYNGVPLYGADVVGLMDWDGKEMPLDDKMKYISDRVPKDSMDRDIKIDKTVKSLARKETKERDSIKKEMGDKKLLGKMKGRYRRVLVDFFSGRMQVPKSLQTGILLGANALWAIDFPIEDRADYLLDLLQGIEVTNPDFSSRLVNEEWDAIYDDICHIVDSMEKLRANPDRNIIKSNKILKRWAAAMRQINFDFGNPMTWKGPFPATRGMASFNLSNEDIEIIHCHIAPIFGCLNDVAVEVVKKMISVSAMKSKNGDGMSREYRRAILTDMGVSCQRNDKLARCWDVVEEAGFIYRKHQHILASDRPGKGRARSYAIGPRIKAGILEDQKVVMPDWLKEATGMMVPVKK